MAKSYRVVKLVFRCYGCNGNPSTIRHVFVRPLCRSCRLDCVAWSPVQHDLGNGSMLYNEGPGCMHRNVIQAEVEYLALPIQSRCQDCGVVWDWQDLVSKREALNSGA